MEETAKTKEIQECIKILKISIDDFEKRTNSYMETNNIFDLINTHMCFESIKPLLDNIWDKINKYDQ